jgi:hypothetical protein
MTALPLFRCRPELTPSDDGTSLQFVESGLKMAIWLHDRTRSWPIHNLQTRRIIDRSISCVAKAASRNFSRSEADLL